MRDFTLEAYSNYLSAIKKAGFEFKVFREFIVRQNEENKCCLVRHDVDRKPLNALRMAKLEYALGVKATYYFRNRRAAFIPEILQQIEALGHEVGYHYENLADTKGNYSRALNDFEENLKLFRKYVKVDTISMHGSPLKPFDNRNLWRTKENHFLLRERFSLLGEVYLDIDYTDIAYITDTGRNWRGKNNVRDKTNSKIPVAFANGVELLNYLETRPASKLVFQVHPERWSNNFLEWQIQYFKDHLANLAKQAAGFFSKE
ncbi:MAG TPA: hypothetical protein VNJ07_14365 [Chitinophagales bacterium]|nr:hypothetical protein [Chitinophagales bacterium]